MEKIILITGISSGIGSAFVKFCVEKMPNWTVVGFGRNNVDFDTGSLKYFYIKTDLLNSLEIKESLETIINKFGRVDVYINNAGVGYLGTVEDLNIVDIRKQFEVNFFGPVQILKKVVSVMRIQNNGQIINISSVGSISPNPVLGYYDATKSAMDKLMDSLSQELNSPEIKVNSLILGAVKSSFGKNIIKFNAETSPYIKLYLDWDKRFRYFFKRRNTAEEVARTLFGLINNPRDLVYLRFLDRMLCMTKKILPPKMFNFLNLNLFFRNES